MALSEAELLTIANTFIATFKDLSISDHIALRAPECIHLFAPSSLGMSEPKQNQDFADHFNNNICPLLDHFHASAKEIHVNLAGRQITIWANATPDFKKEAMGDSAKEDWAYTGEYIFILDVNEEGKIVRVLEFLDSLATVQLGKLFKKARENMGKDGKPW